jgi:hypothetical protein
MNGKLSIGVGSKVSIGVGTSIGIGLSLGVGISIGIGLSTGVGVGVGLSVGIGLGVGVGVGVAEGVGVGCWTCFFFRLGVLFVLSPELLLGDETGSGTVSTFIPLSAGQSINFLPCLSRLPTQPDRGALISTQTLFCFPVKDMLVPRSRRSITSPPGLERTLN